MAAAPSIAKATSSTLLEPTAADQTVSVTRIVAALILGIILAVGITAVVARYRLGSPNALSNLLTGVAKSGVHEASDLKVLASRALAQGASVHHVRITGQDWLVIIGSGGVSAHAVASYPQSIETPE